MNLFVKKAMKSTVMTGKEVYIDTIPVKQNKQDFLIGVFSIEDIFKFTRYTQRLIVSFNEEEQPEYNNQIQRNLENSRVQKIADFLINDPDATFPTNIVLHIPKEVINEYIVVGNRVKIKLDDRVFDDLEKEEVMYLYLLLMANTESKVLRKQ